MTTKFGIFRINQAPRYNILFFLQIHNRIMSLFRHIVGGCLRTTKIYIYNFVPATQPSISCLVIRKITVAWKALFLWSLSIELYTPNNYTSSVFAYSQTPCRNWNIGDLRFSNIHYIRGLHGPRPEAREGKMKANFQSGREGKIKTIF